MVDSFFLNRSRSRLCKGWFPFARKSARSFCARHYIDRVFACQRNYRERKTISRNAILWAMKIISTAEAAKRLGVTADRVRKMIEAKRLKATKFGNVWMIDPKDLEAVKD